MLEDQAGPFSVLTVSFLGWVSGCPGSGMRLVCISWYGMVYQPPPGMCATIGASPNPLAIPYSPSGDEYRCGPVPPSVGEYWRCPGSRAKVAHLHKQPQTLN